MALKTTLEEKTRLLTEYGEGITQGLLKELFTYIDGKLYRENSYGALVEVGGPNPAGYRKIKLFGKVYLTHRLIWCYFKGYMPKAEIDHEDHDRQNNRIGNLREATHLMNTQNATLNCKNTSGVSGVSWCKLHKKYKVTIGGKQESKTGHLGYFADLDAAIACRRAAEVEKGYHKNHGTLPICQNV